MVNIRSSWMLESLPNLVFMLAWVNLFVCSTQLLVSMGGADIYFQAFSYVYASVALNSSKVALAFLLIWALVDSRRVFVKAWVISEGIYVLFALFVAVFLIYVQRNDALSEYISLESIRNAPSFEIIGFLMALGAEILVWVFVVKYMMVMNDKEMQLE